ncbi:hypothetical protein TSOC_011137 [Tetrabaena socialis]|uniref:Uncharacterized protein n=1 Tax=Tetrabaena socialis TaxID=47790 RepID=A0A2J7ZRD7_9CHLO|nr:hypothetical protein TSOC_011137 [Tetrabaena socialis]|eukprot:PNH02845.1 hypothetical protein TSOC_011137 [Tetrabaena socialis]
MPSARAVEQRDSDAESAVSGMEGPVLDDLVAVDSAWRPEVDEFETLYPADMEPDADAARLFDRSKPAGEYAYQAVTRCADPVLPPGHGLGTQQQWFVRTADDDGVALVREASQCLKRTKTGATQPPPQPSQLPSQRTDTLFISEEAGKAFACVRNVDIYNHTVPPTVERIAPGTTPPYIPMDTPPTIDQTIQLFTLASAQGVAFMQLARAFLAQKRHAVHRPCRAIIIGGPGTGKSQIVKALLWFVFQHDHSAWLTTTAYTWTAVLQLNTPYHRGYSTHTAFQLDAFERADCPRKNSSQAVQRYISDDGSGGLGFDEMSFISDSHWGGIAQSARDNLRRLPTISELSPEYHLLAGMPAALFGDPTQHPPVTGDPIYMHAAAQSVNPNYLSELFSGILTPEERTDAILGPTADEAVVAEAVHKMAAATPALAATAAAVPTAPPTKGAKQKKAASQGQPRTKALRILYGNTLYRSFDMVFLLDKQQRQTNDASGRLLTELATAFSGGSNVQSKVERLVRELNSRVVPDIGALAAQNVRVVVQRNDLRHALNSRLRKMRALHLGARVITWKAQHSQVKGGPLNRAGIALALSRDPKEFDFFTPDTIYFEGAKFVMIQNDGPVVGACRNNLVTACGLLLDPREPPEDDPQQPARRLQFPPAAVFVKPVDGACDPTILAKLADFRETHGAFLVTPATVSCDNIDLEHLTDLGSGPVKLKVKLSRRNIPLGDAYVVTDHFVQGASFGDACWVADFAPPPGGIDRASILVMLTRFKSMEHVKVLRPLYNEDNPASFKAVVDAYVRAAPLTYDLKAELERLNRLSEITRNTLADDYAHMERFIAARADTG